MSQQQSNSDGMIEEDATELHFVADLMAEFQSRNARCMKETDSTAASFLFHIASIKIASIKKEITRE